jgi:hypothetical protein
MKKALSLCTVITLTAAISAQTSLPKATIPVGYVTKIGSSAHDSTAFRYANGRTQNIYAPSAAGRLTSSKLISDLWVRPNEWVFFLKPLQAHSYDVEIVVSSKGSKWKTPTTKSFAANHGTDKKVFFKRARINFPAVKGGSSRTVRPWSIHFKGNAPIVAMKGEGFVIDVKTYNKTTADNYWNVDAIMATGVDKGSYQSLGAGCPTKFLGWSRDHYVGAPKPWLVYTSTQSSGDLALNFLGAVKIALKVTPSCTLYTIPVIVHPAPVTSGGSLGYAGFIWGKVPASMGGKKLVSQMAAITPKGQLKLSGGIQVTFGNGKQTSPYFLVSGHAWRTRAFDPDKSAPIPFFSGSDKAVMLFGTN